jgi:UDP-N-acetylmuramoyl-L-alanyl-D-glutamate--2,6-diaminopimelate ligase
LKLTDFLNDGLASIKGVTSDSRQVKSGYLFAALPGTKTDGSDYIGDAIRHGATHVLVDDKVKLEKTENVIFISDANPRQAFSKIVKEFYKLQPENIVAVTGTSGKTSTVTFVQQLWHLSGLTKCASLGTLGVRGPGMMKYGRLTTPDSEKLHAELADLAAVGINHLAMEASSHGLDQFRLDGVNIKAAAFTNLSRDHLDYHKDMESYFAAKARLFSEVMPSGCKAIINADDKYYTKLKKICEDNSHDIISFGYEGETIKIKEIKPLPHGQEVSFKIYDNEYKITLPLVGEFQTMNAMCALGLVLSLDHEFEKYIAFLEKLRGVSGRLQLVTGHPKGAVYVDYAHKPAALETVLNTLRPHTQNKLVCVFGCGGNRDPGKRPMMGKIANDLADIVIVTDDNPRYEEASEIRHQILGKAPKAIEIADRGEAINKAIQNLEKGDVLLIAGKGHEQGQIIGEKILPFDDLIEAQKAIEKVI